jgi:hypothetical protein
VSDKEIADANGDVEKAMRQQRQRFIIDNDDDEGNDAWVADKVRIALNLAYIPEHYARSFTFSEKKMGHVGEAARKTSLKETNGNNMI